MNEHGYNKDGKIHRTTCMIAFYASALIYEDILEISLGAGPVDYDRVRSVDRQTPCYIRKSLMFDGRQVKKNLVDQYQHYPTVFHQRLDRELFMKATAREAFLTGEMQLVYLHQHFLLDRIEYGTEQIDFSIAEEMLRIVLTFWAERELYPTQTDE